MLKSKICFTVLVIYEIIAVALMHNMYICNSMFSSTFCANSGYKYFMICAAIPLAAMVIWLWIDEIFIAHHRRHSLWHRAHNIISDVADDVQDRMGFSFKDKDVAKYITTAILMGLQRYSMRHPNMRQTMDEIVTSSNNNTSYSDMNRYDIDAAEYYEYTDGDDDSDNDNAAVRTTARRNTSARTSRGASRGTSRTSTSASRGKSNNSRRTSR